MAQKLYMIVCKQLIEACYNKWNEIWWVISVHIVLLHNSELELSPFFFGKNEIQKKNECIAFFFTRITNMILSGYTCTWYTSNSSGKPFYKTYSQTAFSKDYLVLWETCTYVHFVSTTRHMTHFRVYRHFDLNLINAYVKTKI